LGGRGAESFAKNKLSWSVKTALELVSNRNYMGLKITDDMGNITFEEKLRDRLLHTGKSTLPTFLSQTARLNKGVAGVAAAAGLNLKTGTNAKDARNLQRMRKVVGQERYYSEKRSQRVRDASPAQLRKMLFKKEITRTQFRNEMKRRRTPEKYFRKRNRAALRRYRKRTE